MSTFGTAMLAENEMKRAAATVASGRNQVAVFDTPPPVFFAGSLGGASLGGSAGAGGPLDQLADTPPSKGQFTMVGDTTHADLVVMAAAFVMLLVQAALAFQKYRFNNGLMLGTRLAAVNWYEDTARRKGLPPSRMTLI
jgi:hypothetical protein